MDRVNGFGDLLRFPGLLDHDDLVRPLGAVFLVEVTEYFRTVPFAVGKTIQDREIPAFRQGAQFFYDGFGRTVEAEIDQRFLLLLGFLDKVEAENRGKAAGIVVPDDIVADEKPAEQSVQLADSRGHPNFVLEHGS